MDQKTGGRYGTHLSGPAVPLGGGVCGSRPKDRIAEDETMGS